ncbi:hypothetical protein RRG08_033430 [Elysia crispata]|uniref:Uncharacterized protein n=1 Tax=Elysia crispata TaxID=231223 RepID=A0AAE1ATV2_9GAST|nr:hypothetical protein RRG08_033430 [Elysia crispata]
MVDTTADECLIRPDPCQIQADPGTDHGGQWPDSDSDEAQAWMITRCEGRAVKLNSRGEKWLDNVQLIDWTLEQIGPRGQVIDGIPQSRSLHCPAPGDTARDSHWSGERKKYLLHRRRKLETMRWVVMSGLGYDVMGRDYWNVINRPRSLI